MPEDAVMDAPVDAGFESSPAPDFTPDITPDSGDSSDPSPTGLDSESPTPEGALDANPQDLSAKALQTLKEIKAKDPALAKMLHNAFQQAEAIKREFPEGFKAVREMKQTLESVGGAEGLRTLQSEQAEFNALDAQFTAGDPKFVESMADASPEAFMAIAPAAFAKFAQLNPDGYASYISQAIVSDMVSQQIPVAMKLLAHFIESGDSNKASEQFNAISSWMERLNGFSKKPFSKPVGAAQPNQDQSREQQLTQRENSIRQQEWTQASAEPRRSIYESEFARLTAGRKISADQKATIEELYRSGISRITANPQFRSKVDAYFKANDREGYLKYMKSTWGTEIPRALRQAVERIVPGKPGPAPTNGTKPATTKPTPTIAPGFTLVPSVPAKNLIDIGRSRGLIQEGKAILTDGRKVTWRR